MVLKQLNYLVALAREKHFGRAALAANISQPTLSAAIRALEDEIGAPIVERGHRFNGLTREGELVLEHAKRILAECDALHQSLAEMGGGLKGRLRLGVIPTALPVVAMLTGPFHARYPGVTISVFSHTSMEIIRGLENFELEVGMTYLDNEPLDHVIAKPIYREDYVFLTPVGSRYAELSSISWAHAGEAPLCLLTPDMQNRRIINGIFLSVGCQPKAAVETNSILNLTSHVSAGHWSSIVPKPFLQTFGLPPATVAVPLVEPEVSRSVGLIRHERDPASPLARAMFVHARPIEFGAMKTIAG